MVDKETSNDNQIAPADAALRGPDAHGQAAMLLVESLIHGLIARSVIEVADAIEIVQIAADAKNEITNDTAGSPETIRRPIDILSLIEASLRIDLPTA